MKRIILAALAAVTALVSLGAAPENGHDLVSMRRAPRAARLPMLRQGLPAAPDPYGLETRATAQAKVPLRAGAQRAATLPGSNTVLTGMKVYSDLWADEANDIDAGFYSIEARPSGKITQLRSNQSVRKMRAGVKVGTSYYAISTADYDETAYLTTFYASGWGTASQSEIDIVNVPTDMTYDPSTGNVYGFFWNDNHQAYDRFCSFNLYYGEATDLYEIDRDGMAIAANADGEIYGIMGATGWLIRLYHSAAESPNGYGFEYIGRTGFSPTYTNSLTFDDATGKLYWCANARDNSGRYSALMEVNTETGAATEIAHFANNATFAGIFAQPYKVPDAAPAAPANLEVRLTENGSTQGRLACTAPSRSYNGGTLRGELSVVFSLNGATVEQVDGVQPGAEVTTQLLDLPAGAFSISALAASSTYLGAETTASGWAGEDSPGPVTALALTDNGGRPTLTWTAPAIGEHGQWFNPAALTYTITRYPDEYTVTGVTATTWTDDTPEGMRALWYAVRAVNTMGSSQPVTTQKVVFGQGFDVPFTETFDTQSAFDLWQVVDLNGNTTWVYDPTQKYVSYSYGLEVERAGDDWLISPKINLRAGVTYALTYSAGTRQKGYPENFRFCLGTSPEPEAMTQTIVDRPNFSNPSGMKDERVLFTVAADGQYYLGLYCYSIAHNWTLMIDNIGMSEVSSQVPSAVSSLTVTPAAEGALKATVTLTAPTTYATGDPMDKTVNIALYRGESTTPVKTWNDVAAGTALSFTDTGLTESGVYTYRATVANANGRGEDAEASSFVGTDLPGMVTDLKFSENADGTVTLTWKAPTEGANGGWFNPEGITYSVIRSHDAKMLATGLTAMTYTDAALGLSEQQLNYYGVWPYTAEGKRGTFAYTPLNVVMGPALQAPVQESFAAADMMLSPWTDESDGSVRLWSLENSGINPYCSDQNGDNGLAMCICANSTKGLTGRFLSPKISLAGVAEPELSFWFYHSASPAAAQGETEYMKVLISKEHGEFTELPGATYHRDNGTVGWTRYTLPLSACKDAAFIRVAFSGYSAGVASMYIDNISISGAVPNDVEVTATEGPSRLAAGVATDYTVTVSNLNTATAANSVKVTAAFRGEEAAPAQTVDLPVGASQKLTFSVSVPQAASGLLTFAAEYEGDQNTANNSRSLALDVVEPVYPAPADLQATADGLNVQLSWLAPDESPAVTDDIESYDDYAIRGFGDYTTVDRDWGNTYAIQFSEDTSYPDMHSPKAFQVLNSPKLGIDIWSEGQPHSGDRFLGALASIDVQNDDWLISPRLNGAQHTFRFWAKAMTTEGVGAEKMLIWYSEGSVNPDDFVKITPEPVVLTDSWTLYSYVLPEGARHWAINCVSLDAFVLMVDDISFNDLTVSTSPVTGYELLRDGVKVADVATSYATDLLAAPGTYKYRVRALFADGHSELSAEYPIEVKETAAGLVSAPLPVVTAAEGAVLVENAEGLPLTVTLPDGRTLLRRAALASASERIPLSPGIYLVTFGAHTVTVTIR